MVDLNGHEAGNGGHSQGTPPAYRDSSTRRDGDFSTTEDAEQPKLRACESVRSVGGLGSRSYCTVTLNAIAWPRLPEVAVTVAVYVPAGVPCVL
jgi:hypothetical protein